MIPARLEAGDGAVALIASRVFGWMLVANGDGLQMGMKEIRGGCVVGEYGWCELVHENPDVFLIRVPYPNITTSYTNCYLIRDGEESLLVDTGAPSEGAFSVLTEALDLIGAPREGMSFFLTHLHLDHAGLVDRVVPEGHPLHVSRVDYELMVESTGAQYRNEMRNQVAAEGVESAELQGFIRHGMGCESFLPEGLGISLVDPGDTIRVGSIEFRVIGTAGHTPGHLSLFEPSSGILLGGDHVLFVVSPVLGIRPGIRDTMKTYIANLRKLEPMGVTKLFHSHGPIRDDWADRAEWLACHQERRLANAAQVIAENPGLTGEEVVRRMKWSARMDEWESIPLPKRWCIMECGIVTFDCLVGDGVVRRDLDAGGVYRYYVE